MPNLPLSAAAPAQSPPLRTGTGTSGAASADDRAHLALQRDGLGQQGKSILQAAALAAAYAVVERLCQAFGAETLAAPAGFLLLLVLLLSGRLPITVVTHGGKCLIGLSTLFLVPAMVAVAPAWPILRAEWLGLSVIIVGGTLFTLIATAWSVEAMCRWMESRR